MSQEELTVSLVFISLLSISIALYAIWIRLDLWAAKRVLEHMNSVSSGREGDPGIGCVGFFVWPLIAATVISFFIFVR